MSDLHLLVSSWVRGEPSSCSLLSLELIKSISGALHWWCLKLPYTVSLLIPPLECLLVTFKIEPWIFCPFPCFPQSMKCHLLSPHVILQAKGWVTLDTSPVLPALLHGGLEPGSSSPSSFVMYPDDVTVPPSHPTPSTLVPIPFWSFCQNRSQTDLRKTLLDWHLFSEQNPSLVLYLRSGPQTLNIIWRVPSH